MSGRVMRFIRWAVPLIVVATLLTAACDRSEQPLVVRNSLAQSMALRVFDEFGAHARVATKTDPILRDTVELAPGEEASVLIDRVTRRGYTLVIEDRSGQELFRQSFARKELDQRQWRLTITDQGIR